MSLTTNDTIISIQKIENARARRLRWIQNSTAEELARIAEKYKMADSVGYGTTMVAIVFLIAFFLTILIIDLTKLLPHIKGHQNSPLNRNLQRRRRVYSPDDAAPMNFKKSSQLQTQIDMSYFRLANTIYTRQADPDQSMKFPELISTAIHFKTPSKH